MRYATSLTDNPPLPPPLWAWLVGTLRGERPAWPGSAAADEAQVVEVGDRLGMLPLLWHRLHDGGECPSTLSDTLRNRALLEAVTAQVRRDETQRILEALKAASVSALVIKGAALAHLVYPLPSLRPACDVDVLLAREDWPRAETALWGVAYRPAKRYFHQVTLAQEDASPLAPYLDVHWEVSEQPVIGRAYTLSELFERSLPIPVLGEGARTVSVADALLMACAHFAQHRQWHRLIWLYDILFVRLACSKRLQAVCRAAMRLADRYFGEPGKTGILGNFVRADAGIRDYIEPSAHLLAQRHRLVHDFLLEMRSRGWRERGRLLRRIVLQPADIRRLDDWTPPAPLRPFVRVHRSLTSLLSDTPAE
jgi:hypothetical protein